MTPRRKKTSHLAPAPAAARMVEDIVGCKWSLRVLDLVSRGVSRPGAMQRSVPGLSTKVLNERLRKLLRFRLIVREVFAEVPPHVEYRLTPLGRRFESVLAQVAALEAELAPAQRNAAGASTNSKSSSLGPRASIRR